MIKQLINKEVTIQLGILSSITDRVKGRIIEVEEPWVKLETSKNYEYINIKSIGRIIIKNK